MPDTWTGRDEPDSKWRTWLSDRQSDRRQDRNVVYSDLAYQVLSPSLLGEAGRFQVTFKPEYQSLAFHRVQVRRDGAWIDRLDPSAISLARRESDFEDGITDGSVTALLVLRFVVGLGLGAELPVASTLVSEFAPARIRGRVVVVLEAFWAVGWVAAAVIGYLVVPASEDGWRWALALA